MEEELNLEILYAGKDYILIDIKGYINWETSEYLGNELEKLFNNHQPASFLIDCKNIEYVSSSGLSVLMALYDLMKPVNGKILLINVKENFQRILELSCLLKFFTLCNSVFEAKSLIGRQ
jgi:anti-sigma B factor antagonist